MAEQNDIQWKNIKTLYQFTYEKGGGYELRIGQWVVNGKAGEKVLGRWEWWTNNQGQRMNGKQKGLSKGDLYRVFTMAQEIAQIMEFPLPSDLAQTKKDEPVPPPAPSGRF